MSMTTATSLCNACASSNLVGLNAESCLIFPGLNGLKTDPIFVVLKVVVCNDCGLMQANLSAEDLEQITGMVGRYAEKGPRLSRS
jgi:hypothetical protein